MLGYMKSMGEEWLSLGMKPKEIGRISEINTDTKKPPLRGGDF